MKTTIQDDDSAFPRDSASDVGGSGRHSIERYMFGESEEAIVDEISDYDNLSTFDTASYADHQRKCYEGDAPHGCKWTVFKVTITVERVHVDGAAPINPAPQTEAKTK